MEKDGVVSRSLSFPELDITSLSPLQQNVAEALRTALSTELQYWSVYPIQIPPSLLPTEAGLKLYDDLIVPPNYNESEVLSREYDGTLKKLTKAQLQHIRETGKFYVSSELFPGRDHGWTLNRFFQKGKIATFKSLLDNISLALTILLDVIPDVIKSDQPISLRRSFQEFCKGFRDFIDLCVGVRSTERHHDYYRAIDAMTELQNLWFLSKCIVSENYEPYGILTAECGEDEFVVDTRMLEEKKREESYRIISEICETVDKEWQGEERSYQEMLQSMWQDEILKAETPDDRSKLAQRIVDKCAQEKAKRKLDAVQNSPELHKLFPQPSCVDSFLEYHKAIQIIRKAISNRDSEISRHRVSTSLKLKIDHPLRSRVSSWLDKKVEEEMKPFETRVKKEFKGDIVDTLRNENCHSIAGMLSSSYHFSETLKPTILEPLGKRRSPTRTIRWPFLIWRTSHYVVSARVERSRVEIEDDYCDKYGMMDVIEDEKEVISGPYKSVRDQVDSEEHPEKYVFTLSSEKQVRNVSSNYLLWRWFCILMWIVCWINNVNHFLLKRVIWQSPVGIQALFRCHSFYASDRINRVGEIVPDKGSKTTTFASRLVHLWRGISRSRREFEAAPDTGILGKSISRIFNVLWNYIIVGFFGTLGLFLFPPLCIIVFLFSCALSLTSVVWIPTLCLFLRLLMMFFYDVWGRPGDPDGEFMCWKVFALLASIFRMLIGGILNFVTSVVVVVLLAPLLALLIVLASFIRYALRTMWDVFVFHCVLKRRGRQPSRDSFVARRTSGPGLAQEVFVDVDVAFVIALLQVSCERDMLEKCKSWHENQLNAPSHNFSVYCDKILHSFGCKSTGLPVRFTTTAQHAKQVLRSTYQDRVDRVSRILNNDILVECRMLEGNLQIVYEIGERFCREYYTDLVFKYIKLSTFWEMESLPLDSFKELVEKKLTQIFSSQFLIPIDEEQFCTVKLEVAHSGFKTFCSSLMKGEEIPDGLSRTHKHLLRGVNVLQRTTVSSVSAESFFPSHHNYGLERRVHFSESVLSSLYKLKKRKHILITQLAGEKFEGIIKSLRLELPSLSVGTRTP